MKQQITTLLLVITALIFLIVSNVSANCQGCCSWHGGVVCRNGVTMCADGTPLSSKCRAKGCNKCGTYNYRPTKVKSYKKNTKSKSSLKKTNLSGPPKVYVVPYSSDIMLLVARTTFAAQFMVTRVYDGDTITVESEDFKLKVRLVGIDAPEKSRKNNKPGQPYSQKAKIYLEKLVLNKTVELVSYGLDRYSRILAVIYISGLPISVIT